MLGCLLVIPPKVNMTGRAVTTSRQVGVSNNEGDQGLTQLTVPHYD
jgi:hypothetical protein